MLILCRKLISKVRNVLEAQSPRRHHRITSTITPGGDAITIRTDVRQFESFLRSINRCSSLLDARRLKNDVMGEIRRTRLLLGTSLTLISGQQVNFYIANHEKEEWINGERTEDVVAFLDRLYTAKRTVEQRIVVLGGEQDPVGFIHLTFLRGPLMYSIQPDSCYGRNPHTSPSLVQRCSWQPNLPLILDGIYGSSPSFATCAILANCRKLQESFRIG